VDVAAFGPEEKLLSSPVLSPLYSPSDGVYQYGDFHHFLWRGEGWLITLVLWDMAREGAGMGDWDFLYEMNERGFSPEEIADAAACGYAPYETLSIDSDWLDSQLEDEPVVPFQSREGFPFSVLDQIQIFEDLVACAERHFENTGRYLQVWGELGEIFAEIKFGLRRHGTHTAGSDGTIAGKLVEVKTISPEKASDHVFVKSQGDFEQLLIVRIDRDFQFEGKLFDRSELKGANGKFLRGRLKDDASNT
jgi:hypothetical protein